MTGAGWREARARAGLALRRVAELAGISPPFLSDVEHGRRRFSAEVEARVRKVLGLHPAPPSAPAPRCVVCETELEVTTEHVYDPSTGPPVYGPGSIGQYRETASITCPRCGIMYAHEPRAASSGREPGKEGT